MSTTRTSRKTRALVGAAALLGATPLLAACGGGTGYGSSPPARQPGAAAGGVVLKTGSTPAGTVLVDSRGRTLYAFAADAPGRSNCTGSCAAYWPPATVSGSLTHASDVTAALSTIRRADGSTQLTANGWPLYTYAGDSGPGQSSGQGEDLSGGRWWVVAASGTQIKTGGSSAGDADGY